MPLKRHALILDLPVRRALLRSTLSSQCNHCRFSSTSAAPPESIAVLGGGISGLSSAHFVAKEFPNSKITIFEATDRSGGWLQSKRVELPGGHGVFEYGPRTLRPGVLALATAQLIADLKLEDDVLFTPRTSPAAQNRYIYYPDRLNRMPNVTGNFLSDTSNLLALLRSGILNGSHNIIAEAWQPQRPPHYVDESMGHFVARRVDRRVAQNILSSVIHGVYAGDIWQLSARSLLSTFWYLESHYGSVLGGMAEINKGRQQPSMVFPAHPHKYKTAQAMVQEVEQKHIWKRKFVDGFTKCSTFTFKNGMQQLSQTLYDSLQKNPQVDIRMGSRVNASDMAYDGSGQVKVVTGEDGSQTTQNFDLVISTLPNRELTPFVTVMTVNLYFSTPNLVPVTGFGYLIPQSIPFAQNPERALGVIFDSDAVTGQDSVHGTKLTVMLGGHLWDGWQGYPDEYEGAELAKSVIARHLGITEEPVACHVNLNRDCIPQYICGHQERLTELAEKLRTDFHGKVRVVGNQYDGVGVNDCIRGAWSLAQGLKGDGWRSSRCGLEGVLDNGSWIVDPLPKPFTS